MLSRDVTESLVSNTISSIYSSRVDASSAGVQLVKQNDSQWIMIMPTDPFEVSYALPAIDMSWDTYSTLQRRYSVPLTTSMPLLSGV